MTNKIVITISFVFANVTVCGAMTAQETRIASEIELAKADSEVFAAVIRLQPESAADSLGYHDAALEIDARPWGEPKNFRDVAGGGTGLASRDIFFLPDSLLSRRLADVRRKLLTSIGRKEGKGFSFPQCGGTLAGPSPPPSDTSARAAHYRSLHSGCPASDQTYLNIGIPFHGVPEAFKKSRTPIDTEGDVWTVVANEHYVGASGQNWFQNALILKRDPATGRLRVTQKVLLSWAE